jgi:tRNA (guanosine-2'-O-)-methyltransferase
VSVERLTKLRAVLARRQPDLAVVMENVHKPHNFSAVVRTCDAVGVLDTWAVTATGTLSANIANTSSAEKWVRIHTTRTVREAVAEVKARGLRVIAAHLSDEAIDFRAYDYSQPTALLLGQELGGVTEEALALVDAQVVVPMAGMIASLNVSVAAAVILYEAQRQREAARLYETPRLPEAERDRLLFEWLYPDVADILRKRGEPYPPLDEHGHMVRTPSAGW